MNDNGIIILTPREVAELVEKRGALHLGADGGVTIFGGPEPGQRAEFSRAPALKAAAAVGGRAPARSAAAPSGPRSLAEAIRAEQLAGAGEDAAERAGRKYPGMVSVWGDKVLSTCFD